jgi:hypothetical protein
VSEPAAADLRTLQTFVVRLGAAMNAVGEPAYSVQDRLGRVARGYGANSARLLFGTLLLASVSATGRVVGGLSEAIDTRHWLRRKSRASRKSSTDV